MSQVAKLKPVQKKELFGDISVLELHDGVTLDINMNVKQACEFMIENGFLSLGVVDENKVLYGFFSVRFFMQEILYKQVSIETPLKEIIFKNPLDVYLTDPLIKVLHQCNFRPEAVFPVIDEKGKVVHNFWMRDIITRLCEVFKDSLEGLGAVNKNNFFKLVPEDDYKNIEDLEDELKILHLVSPLKRVVGTRPVVSELNLSVGEVIESLVREGANMFIQCKYGIDMIGAITDRILFQHFYERNFKELYQIPVSDYLIPPPEILLEEHLVGHGLTAFGNNNSRRVLVVDRDLVPLKVLEPVDLIRYLNSGHLGDLWLQLESSLSSQSKSG